MKKEKTPIPYSNKLKEINNRYPKTSDNIMLKIFNVDHKYYEYLLKIYHYRNRPLSQTFTSYIKLVNEFDELIPQMEVDDRDIYNVKYLDPKYLGEIVKKYREIRDEKKFQTELSKHATKIIDNDNLTVLNILTPEAGERYGRGTRWCITNNLTFQSYFRNNHIFFIIFKKTDEKYALLSSRTSMTLGFDSIWNKNDNRVEKRNLYKVNNDEVDLYERFNCMLECFTKLEITVFQEYEKHDKKIKVEKLIKQLNGIDFTGIDFMVDKEQKELLNQSINDFINRINIKKNELFNFDIKKK